MLKIRLVCLFVFSIFCRVCTYSCKYGAGEEGFVHCNQVRVSVVEK